MYLTVLWIRECINCANETYRGSKVGNIFKVGIIERGLNRVDHLILRHNLGTTGQQMYFLQFPSPSYQHVCMYIPTYLVLLLSDQKKLLLCDHPEPNWISKKPLVFWCTLESQFAYVSTSCSSSNLQHQTFKCVNRKHKNPLLQVLQFPYNLSMEKWSKRRWISFEY